jgi:phosphonate degradation associated HDIG domain protein
MAGDWRPWRSSPRGQPIVAEHRRVLLRRTRAGLRLESPRKTAVAPTAAVRRRAKGEPMTADTAAAAIAALFASEGAAEYLGEPVSQAAHMLQAAALAERDCAGKALTAGALLHDVGHFTAALNGHDVARGGGNGHAASGAAWLAQWFGEDVTEPVRLHVAAKRYLCAVEPGYVASLSSASATSLRAQGGPMRRAELAEFEANRYAAAAVRLRRWDDASKDPKARVPELDGYLAVLEALAR